MNGQHSSTSDFISLTVGDLDEGLAERLLAEAVEAGAVGAEQREESGGVTLILYVPRGRIDAVVAACRGLGAEPAPPDPLEDVDWSEAWKAELRAVEISPRLRVRPPFDETPLRPGQRELVIEPGQAFGTGGHESTRLALAWIDALAAGRSGSRVLDGQSGSRVLDGRPGSRVLDAGVGSGVLALAALAGGARLAVGFDLDALAAPAARANALCNGLAEGLLLFTGPVEALHPEARFDGIAANLLRRELEPLLPALAARLQAGGWFVISGLLADELPDVAARAAACGLRLEGRRAERDASGIEWVAALLRHEPPPASLMRPEPPPAAR